MLKDTITDYSLYTIENGLPFAITANSYSTKDEEGNLYIPARNGIVKVNINHYYEENERLLMNVKSIYCDDERIYPDSIIRELNAFREKFKDVVAQDGLELPVVTINEISTQE